MHLFTESVTKLNCNLADYKPSTRKVLMAMSFRMVNLTGCNQTTSYPAISSSSSSELAS